MLELSFHQTKSEMMVRAASTIIFKALSRNKYPLIKLSEIAEKPQYGFTASASFEPNQFQYIRITDLKDGSIKWDTTPYCECNEPEKYLIKSGDILFARTGATTGKTHLVKESKNAVFASYLIRLRPKKYTDSEYLYCFLKSDSYWSQIADKKEGSAQPNVNGRKLLNIKLPIVDEKLKLAIAKFIKVVRKRQGGSNEDLPELPHPLEEQRRIVAKVEELAGKIEEARSLREQTIKETEALIKSELSVIFNKLAKQSDNYRLDKLILDASYGTSAKCEYERQENSIPVLRIPNVSSEKVNFQNIKYGILNNTELSKLIITEGDLLIVRSNGSADLVGRCAVVPTVSEPIAFASYLIKLNCDRKIINPYYLQVTMRHLRNSGVLFNLARTTAGQFNVSLGRLRSAQIPVPSLEEQQRIVAYLDRLQSKVDEMKRLREKAIQELDALLPSILDKAFKGEL